MDTDAAYFAGLLDGEGSFTFKRSKNGQTPCASLNLEMTDIEPMDWLVTTFGGRHTPRVLPSGRSCYSWRIYGLAMVAAVERAEPFLHAKSGQASLWLQLARHHAGVHNIHRRISTTDRLERERLVLELSRIKGEGKSNRM